jgi:hypothetical protein
VAFGVDVCQEGVEFLIGVEHVVTSHLVRGGHRPQAQAPHLLVESLMPHGTRTVLGTLASTTGHADHLRPAIASRPGLTRAPGTPGYSFGAMS